MNKLTPILSYCQRQLRAGLNNPTFLRYLTGGMGITCINLGLFSLLVWAGCRATRANLIALCVAKASGFLINKYYVYRIYDMSIKHTGKELGKYVFSRLLTGVLDYYGLMVLIEIFGFPVFLSKYTVMGGVIILNYVLGKYFVFISHPQQAVK